MIVGSCSSVFFSFRYEREVSVPDIKAQLYIMLCVT